MEINEKIDKYYTDAYSLGETKEQINIGDEVAKPREVTGTINTSDTLTKANQIFNLSIPNPDGVIFSIGIDGREKTFKVGFFGNTALAYSTLETELQAWLGADYTITYVSGTNFTIKRFDLQSINISTPNLAREIFIEDFNSISVLDVIVDGLTITLDGPTLINTTGALSYLNSQLSSTTYFKTLGGSSLIIARKDGVIPVITQTQYNKYTYVLKYKYDDTPTSGQFWEYTDTTIDGVTYRTPGSLTRAFKGDEIIRNIKGYSNTNIDTGTFYDTRTSKEGLTITDIEQLGTKKLTTIEKSPDCTGTKAYLVQGGVTLSTVNFVGNVATFNYNLTDGLTYKIEVDNNGATYNSTRAAVGSTTTYPLFTINSLSRYNIDKINIVIEGMDLSSYSYSTRFNEASGYDTDWDGDSVGYFGYFSELYLNKPDYSAISISSTNKYTISGTFPNDTLYTTITETNNIANTDVIVFPDLSITLTLSSNDFYIPTNIYAKNIKITAVSSAGSSEGVYSIGTQSCTSVYGTTTEFVNNKIFKTNADNHGYIVSHDRGGFTINYTTDRSNKLNYTCYN